VTLSTRVRAASRGRHEEGAALVEFIGLALILLIPLVYLTITVGRVQAGAFAAESAARDAARGAVVAGVAALEAGDSVSSARARAWQRAGDISAVVVQDFGFDADDHSSLSLSCSSTPCFEQGSVVSSRVDVHVALPGIPGFVHAIAPVEVTVSAHSRSPVDGLAGSP